MYAYVPAYFPKKKNPWLRHFIESIIEDLFRHSLLIFAMNEFIVVEKFMHLECEAD